MKKLLKSDIYGSMNSARMHCSRLKSQPLRLKAKKKKKAEIRIAANVDTANADPNRTVVLLFVSILLLFLHY